MSSVGFIVLQTNNEKVCFDETMGNQLNNLLMRLNRRFPQIFPHDRWSGYSILDSSSIKEDTRIDVMMCLGEEAYQAAKKRKQVLNSDFEIINIKHFRHSISKRKNRMIYSKKAFRIRSNFQVLQVYKEIEQTLLKSKVMGI